MYNVYTGFGGEKGLSVASQLHVCSDESIKRYTDWYTYICSGDPMERYFDCYKYVVMTPWTDILIATSMPLHTFNNQNIFP
jgi:hypothetical protein